MSLCHILMWGQGACVKLGIMKTLAATEHNDDGHTAPGIAVEERTRVKEPKQYAVILHNDDYTTMEFVIDILKRFFKKNQAEAMDIMLKVHELGHGVAGIYGYEIAETKVAQVSAYAQAHDFPLKCSIEEHS